MPRQISNCGYPRSSKSVDVEKKRQESIEFYKNSGYEDKARELEESPSATVFWFETSEMGSTLYRTNVNIQSVLMTAASLDDLLEQESTSDLPQYVVVNRQDFQVGNYEARRILTEANFSNVYLGIAQYVIFDGTNVWIITCGSHFNEFYGWLPEFDKIARTFRLIGQ